MGDSDAQREKMPQDVYEEISHRYEEVNRSRNFRVPMCFCFIF